MLWINARVAGLDAISWDQTLPGSLRNDIVNAKDVTFATLANFAWPLRPKPKISIGQLSALTNHTSYRAVSRAG